MTRNQQPKRQSPIKIVFRQGKRFVCGMCRTSYQSQKEAKSCLRDDVERLITLQPVQVVKRGEEFAYRCSICSRDYDQYDLGLACARECKYELDKKRILEEKITGIPLRAPDPKKFAKRTPIAVPIQQIAKVSLKRSEIEPAPKTRPAVSEEEQKTIQIEEFTGAEDDTPAAQEKPANNTKRRRTSEVKEKFYREDAKYVCSVCNEKYFTKVEVEQCFDAHVAEEQAESA